MHIDGRIITAHWNETRERNAIRLQNELSGPGGLDITIERASQDESPWATVKRALRRGDETVTHHLILQDDVKVVDEFAQLLRQAIDARPGDVIGLFANRKQVNEARGSECPWATCPGIWGQAWVIPEVLVDDLIGWCETNIDDGFPHDDARVSLWLRYGIGQRAWFPLPSLVEHVGHNQSELGNNPPVDRTATWYEQSITPDAVDYTDQSDPVVVPGSDAKSKYGDAVRESVFE